MCTIPPAPPPPPTSSIKEPNSPTQPNKSTTDVDAQNSNVCEWATDPQLREACAKNELCLHKPPFQYKYKHFESIRQVGPTCGLVALSMLVNNEVSSDEMLNIAKLEGYSNNGEMFSCKNMMKLTEKVFSLAEINVKYSLQKGGLFSKETIEKLLNGAVLLVPYDADFNHSPCLKQGHRAHWSLVCGVIIIDDLEDPYDADNVHVLCKHGKSWYLAVWKLDDLDKSNKNLQEFSCKRGEDGLIYVLPEGGVGGENGLRDQFLIFEGF